MAAMCFGIKLQCQRICLFVDIKASFTHASFWPAGILLDGREHDSELW